MFWNRYTRRGIKREMKNDSPVSVIFKQKRIGKDGKVFSILLVTRTAGSVCTGEVFA